MRNCILHRFVRNYCECFRKVLQNKRKRAKQYCLTLSISMNKIQLFLGFSSSPQTRTLTGLSYIPSFLLTGAKVEILF